MPIRNSFRLISFSVILIAGVAIITFQIDRSESLLLLGAYSLMFLSYLLLIKSQEDARKYLFGLGILARLVLLFSLPVLSDDFFRFIWDGRLLLNRQNPFEQLPAGYLNQGLQGIDQDLYNQLNSKEYFTIYPPLNQFLFWVSASLSGGKLLFAVNVMRFPIILADVGIYFTLLKWSKRNKLQFNIPFLYWLNPLVILELTGNLHFEGIMMFFVLLGLVWYKDNKNIKGALSWGLAVCSKLLPLMYLPTLLIYMKWKKALISYVAIGSLVVLLFLPLISSEFITGLTSSIGLYFQKFEFNGSIYIVIREFGFWITGYNQIAEIGPTLGIMTLILILFLNFLAYKKKWSMPFTLLSIHTVYLMMATTVHPWYVVSILCLSCLTNSRFALVWSFLIFLTYLGYTDDGFEQPVLAIWMEYIVVFSLVIMELKGWDKWLQKLFVPRPV